MKRHYNLLLSACIVLPLSLFGQSEKEQLINGKIDTTRQARSLRVRDSARNISPADTTTIAKHSPRKATFRSAVLPGWGQAYNREYWKIPLVYAAIGVPAGFYIYNDTWYKRSRVAYEIIVTNDTLRFNEIHGKLRGLKANSLQYYRNSFRKDRDYSILYFLLMWGLNVADATVFGHLKDFDVSDDLSLRINPGYSPLARTSGVSLVLAVKSPRERSVINMR